MTVNCGAIVLALIGFGAGVTSAVYWYRSAQVDLKHPSAVPYDPNDPLQREPVLLAQKQLWADVRQTQRTEANWRALVAASREMGRLNKIAAVWTAGAVLFATASSVWSAMQWP